MTMDCVHAGLDSANLNATTPAETQVHSSTLEERFFDYLTKLAQEGETLLIVKQLPKIVNGVQQQYNDGTPKYTWPAFRPTKRMDKGAWYINSGAFIEDRFENGRPSAANRCCEYVVFMMLDDIGTKSKPIPGIQPTWVIETSPGNYQHGYAYLHQPKKHKHCAAVIALADAGYTDKGATNAVRNCRLPGSVNLKPEKNEFEARLVSFNPEHEFTVEEICAAAGVTPEPADALKKSGWPSITINDDGGDDVFAWLGAKGFVVDKPNASGWAGVVCPNHAEHTDGSLEARYNPSARSFCCYHGHCTDWNSIKFLEWVKANGGPNQPPGLRDDLFQKTMASVMNAIRADDVEQSTSTILDTASPEWDIPADIFSTPESVPFPLKTLPVAFQNFATGLSRASGIDAGAYAFSLLASTANLIDHRVRLKLNQDWQAPPMLWAALVADSGAAKSPALNAATKTAKAINAELARHSKQDLETWYAACQAIARVGQKPPKPEWKQFIAQDATTEALAALLADNPSGLTIIIDEMTDVIGRMDAYSNGEKDRGFFLSAFDGGPRSIHRVTAQRQNVYLDNCSLGIVTSVQPEKLADLYRKSNNSSDGLFQRFICYNMAIGGKIDVDAEFDSRSIEAADAIVKQVRLWTDAGTCLEAGAELAPDARKRFGEHANVLKTLAESTPPGRFQEHLQKLRGVLLRLTLALHVIECASGPRVSNGQFPNMPAVPLYSPLVSLETLERALSLTGILYLHSEALYSKMMGLSGAHNVAQDVAEVILSHRLTTCSVADLTRNVKSWRNDTDGRLRAGAIDLLIADGWLRPSSEVQTQRRGRKPTLGLFEVNPAVHQTFASHAERIKERSRRHVDAIRQASAERKRATDE